MKELYYELGKDGYDIYDRNDKLYHVAQYGEYNKPIGKTKTIEENAQLQLAELSVEPEPSNNPYGIPNDVYLQIQADEEQKAVNKIVEGVNGNEA